MKILLVFCLIVCVFNVNAADIQKNLEVHYDLVRAGDKSVVLLGTQVQLGQTAPNFKVVDGKFETKALTEFVGKPIIISVVPSLDTGVCSIQTKRFNDEVSNLPQDVVMLTISADLPFAQKRFCQAENVDKLVTLSDSVWRDFGMNYGVLIKDMGLLARSVFVIGPDGVLFYKEIVANLSEQPNYEAAFSAVMKVSEQN